MIKTMPKGEIEVALGKCDLCETIKPYLFCENRCLESCESCDVTTTVIVRVDA